LAEDFLRRKRAALSDPDTFEARLRNYTLLALGAHTANTLRPMHVEDMLNAMVADGLSPQTANHVRDGGRQLVSFAIDNGEWPGANPFAKVKPLELPEPDHVMLTKAETGALLRNVRRFLAPLFAVAIYLGARRDTIFNIRCSDVDMGLKTIQLLKTKTGKRISNVPIPDELVPYLRDALTASYGDWLFMNRAGEKRTRDSGRALNKEIQRALRLAGILREGQPPPLTFRGLRRLSASLHQEAGAAPWVVSRILGHSQASLVAAGNPAENVTARHYSVFSEQFVRQELNKLRFHGE
jgi:integrase